MINHQDSLAVVEGFDAPCFDLIIGSVQILFKLPTDDSSVSAALVYVRRLISSKTNRI